MAAFLPAPRGFRGIGCLGPLAGNSGLPHLKGPLCIVVCVGVCVWGVFLISRGLVSRFPRRRCCSGVGKHYMAFSHCPWDGSDSPLRSEALIHTMSSPKLLLLGRGRVMETEKSPEPI